MYASRIQFGQQQQQCPSALSGIKRKRAVKLEHLRERFLGHSSTLILSKLRLRILAACQIVESFSGGRLVASAEYPEEPIRADKRARRNRIPEVRTTHRRIR